ncbi:hypothetical protein SS50377_21200 [Spironucleus salmonicida]|uniref:Uncharacterized protein n=1 Tax=Spironucleus salmonicida TaxID=348837 RepID=V6LT55_9EUKA|nr:hypothetical protein SS50377_21200 [Spironucleus salmonicida]|eukprot:EST43974.1 Hypothetical protein SS50377_16282 [Spironucleus salmonicida]
MSIQASLQKSLNKTAKNIEQSQLHFSSLNLNQAIKQQVSKWNQDCKYAEKIDQNLQQLDKEILQQQSRANQPDHLSMVMTSYPDIQQQQQLTKDNFETELSRQYQTLNDKYQTQEIKVSQEIAKSQQTQEMANIQIKEFVTFISQQLQQQIQTLYDNSFINKLMDPKIILKLKNTIQQISVNYENITSQRKLIYEQYNIYEKELVQENIQQQTPQIRSLAKMMELQNKYQLLLIQNQAYLTRNNALEEERTQLLRKITQLEDYNKHKGTFTEQIILASQQNGINDCLKCKYIDSIVEENQRLRQQLNDSVITQQNMKSTIVDLQNSLFQNVNKSQVLSLHHDVDDVEELLATARSQLQ